MKKKSSLYVLAGIGLVVACATSQTAEDLCDPRLRSCSLYAGIQHTGGGSMMDASTGGQIATGGESGAAGTTGGTATGGGGTPTGGGGHGGGGMSTGGGGMSTGGGGMATGGGGMSTGGGGMATGGGGMATGGGGMTSGGGGAGGATGGGGTGGTGGTAQCTVANQATTCNDNKPCTDDSCVGGACMHANNTAPCTDDGDGCTDDVCGGGACTHPMNTAPCTGDYDLCTDDVCAAGTCTHPALNPCGGLVKIQTNRGGGANYVKLDANNQLVWTATTLATAETFQLTFTGTDQVKMMATSNNMWVTLDQTNDNDFLVANGAAAANAATINIVLCAAVNALASSCAPNCRGMEVVDDNSSKFVASDDQGVAVGDLLRARSGDCGGSATAWESWRFVEQ